MELIRIWLTPARSNSRFPLLVALQLGADLIFI